MPRHILFSDIDGTLIKERIHPIHLKDLKMMKEIQKEGHLIALCTGKHKEDLMMTLENCAIPYDYLVLCNGGTILDKDGQIMIEETIPNDVGISFIQYCLKNNLIFYFACHQGMYGYNNQVFEKMSFNEKEEITAPIVDFIKTLTGFTILGYNVAVLNEVENLKIVHDFLEVNHLSLSWCRNLDYVDISPFGCNKGSGIKKLIDFIEDEIDLVYSIGDSYNDIEMFKASDISYSFNRCIEEIRKEVDKLVDYVYELCHDILNKGRL